MITTTRSELSALALLVVLSGCETKRVVHVAPAETPSPTTDDDAPPKGEKKRLPDDEPPPLAPEVPQARIVASSPAPNEEDFYPVEIYDQGEDKGVGERRVLSFTFDRAMDASQKTVGLRPGDRALDGRWSEDAKTFELVLLGHEDVSPLEAETEYELDFGDLRSEADEPVGTPRVRFTTAARDGLIEHACIHTLFGPFESLSAAAREGALASAPAASSTHKQYSIALPKTDGRYAGDLRVAFSGSGPKHYALLVDGDAEVGVTGDGGSVTVTKSATVEACPGIRRRFDVDLTRGATYRLAVTSNRATIKAIWEAP